MATKLFASYSSRTVSSHRSADAYGDWSERIEFTVGEVSLTEPVNYNRDYFTVSFDAVAGDKVHVLTMIYSTGDSFGRGDGYGEILWVFKDPKIAFEAEKTWRERCINDPDHNESWEDRMSTKFLADNKLQVMLSNPCADYFARLQDLRVEERIVRN